MKEYCPKCDSDNVYLYKKSGILTFIFSILFMALIPAFRQKTYFCFECKHEWKRDKNAFK